VLFCIGSPEKNRKLTDFRKTGASAFFRRENSPRFARLIGGKSHRREMRIGRYFQVKTALI
jgi:hypothetical protein